MRDNLEFGSYVHLLRVVHVLYCINNWHLKMIVTKQRKKIYQMGNWNSFLRSCVKHSHYCPIFNRLLAKDKGNKEWWNIWKTLLVFKCPIFKNHAPHLIIWVCINCVWCRLTLRWVFLLSQALLGRYVLYFILIL